MSRTIKTNVEMSYTYFTNINSEQLIGKICKAAGAKFFNEYNAMLDHYKDNKVKKKALLELKKFWENNDKMAYSMSKEEAKDAVEKLEKFTKNKKKFEKFWKEKAHYHFEVKEITELIIFLENFIKFLKDSKGYDCIG